MRGRAIAAPVLDYRRDRPRWAGLIRDVHLVAAGEGSTTARALAEVANSARNLWTPLAGYPSGVVCDVFATTAWAWARAVDGEAREQLKGMMLTSAGMVDQLLSETETPALANLDIARASAQIGGRLPYRES